MAFTYERQPKKGEAVDKAESATKPQSKVWLSKTIKRRDPVLETHVGEFDYPNAPLPSATFHTALSSSSLSTRLRAQSFGLVRRMPRTIVEA